MGKNRQLITGVFFVAVFLVLGLMIGVSRVKADSVCLPEVKLDYYYCGNDKPDKSGDCGSVVYRGGTKTYQCNTADPQCRTTTAACSSNDVGLGCHAVGDRCIPNSPGCSQSQCWSSEGPTPTPGPERKLPDYFVKLHYPAPQYGMNAMLQNLYDCDRFSGQYYRHRLPLAL